MEMASDYRSRHGDNGSRISPSRKRAESTLSTNAEEEWEFLRKLCRAWLESERKPVKCHPIDEKPQFESETDHKPIDECEQPPQSRFECDANPIEIECIGQWMIGSGVVNSLKPD